MKIRRMVLALTIFSFLSGGAFTGETPAETERWEGRVSTSRSDALMGMLKRLPSTWSAKRKARRIASTLPDYEGTVTIPDSEIIYSWIEGICKTPHRRPGTAYGHRAERWVAERFREIGLKNVTLDPVPITVWMARHWSLMVAGEETPSFFVLNTGFTGPEGVTAPLVYVGTGTPEDFKRVDVSGKIVVADVPFPYMPTGVLVKLTGGAYMLSDPDHSVTLGYGQYLNFVRQNFVGGTTAETAPKREVYWQAYRHGAAAICLILRDQPSNSNTHYGPYDGIMKPLPGLWVGKYDGMRLRELSEKGAEATLELTGGSKPGAMHNVWGILPGVSDEVILVTSHHDSPFQGAVEDGAGVAQVLAQAWAWSRVPKEQRPKTMVFVVDAGHFYGSLGAHAFAREHKEIMKRARILITLEHLGAKEVEERDQGYAETGRLAFTVMFTSPDPTVIAVVMKALKTKPARVTAPLPADLFGPAPTSDAAGYVLEAGVPVISWIGCPYYLLDDHDTLDKIEKGELKSIAETATEIVKVFMAME